LHRPRIVCLRNSASHPASASCVLPIVRRLAERKELYIRFLCAPLCFPAFGETFSFFREHAALGFGLPHGHKLLTDDTALTFFYPCASRHRQGPRLSFLFLFLLFERAKIGAGFPCCRKATVSLVHSCGRIPTLVFLKSASSFPDQTALFFSSSTPFAEILVAIAVFRVSSSPSCEDDASFQVDRSAFPLVRTTKPSAVYSCSPPPLLRGWRSRGNVGVFQNPIFSFLVAPPVIETVRGWGPYLLPHGGGLLLTTEIARPFFRTSSHIK